MSVSTVLEELEWIITNPPSSITTDEDEDYKYNPDEIFCETSFTVSIPAETSKNRYSKLEFPANTKTGTVLTAIYDYYNSPADVDTEAWLLQVHNNCFDTNADDDDDPSDDDEECEYEFSSQDKNEIDEIVNLIDPCIDEVSDDTENEPRKNLDLMGTRIDFHGIDCESPGKFVLVLRRVEL